MLQSRIAALLLMPFSLLYGGAMSLRDFFYRKGLLKSIEFNVPVIAVGNLSIGGAGKSPHIEYLVRLLKDHVNIATLSRGYKRKSKGFKKVEPSHNAEIVGDEPLQFKRKFPEITVTVSESRTFGITEIMSHQPDMEAILLDDAFQHRSVKPGINILLTQFSKPFTQDYLLPSGRLREWKSGYERADIIIVSKCPIDVTQEEKDNLIKEINPLSHQKIFFSYYDYQNPYYLFKPDYKIQLTDDIDALVVSAIAGTEYLEGYLETKVKSITSLEYEDHHYYSEYDISQIFANYQRLDSQKKCIITTEKDAMRMELHRDFLIKNNIPIFVLPVEVKFHFDEAAEFDKLIQDYLLEFKV